MGTGMEGGCGLCREQEEQWCNAAFQLCGDGLGAGRAALKGMSLCSLTDEDKTPIATNTNSFWKV